MVFYAGDCLVFICPDGDYGAAIVLNIRYENSRILSCLVAVLRYKSSVKPDASVFESRHWLILTHHAWKGEICNRWCLSSEFKPNIDNITKVGETQLRSDDPIVSSRGGGWYFHIQLLSQLAWEAEHPMNTSEP